jgi:hypothetical protein
VFYASIWDPVIGLPPPIPKVPTVGVNFVIQDRVGVKCAVGTYLVDADAHRRCPQRGYLIYLEAKGVP